MRTRTIGTSLAAVMLLVPATAMGVNYPPPTNPGSPAKPPKNTHTLKVCKKGAHCFRTIQKAVNAAKAGDTLAIAPGTYREGVKITGKKKAFLRLIGNPAKPRSVVIDAAKKQNGVLINGADNVTVSGIYARNYLGNGFFAVNVDGYDFNHLVAGHGGTYGIYAFNSKGGRMTDSEAFYNNDGGFYVGQTPKQTKPKRTIAKNDVSWGNVIGWSGTNMRYVTITKSKFFDNGTGIVPNALDSEKYPPAEDNVIADNDVFWNNFNYYKAAPFRVKGHNKDSTPYPVGVGILLFGSRTTQVTGNRVYGNFLAGAGMIKQFLLNQEPGAQDLIGNRFTNNAFGLGGADRNGRDLVYDGNGNDNCFAGNTGVAVTTPSDGSTFAACPFSGANAFSDQTEQDVVTWALDPTHEAYWVKGAHVRKAGFVPLEDYRTYAGKKAPK
jgi:hypothetical protein